MGSARRLRLMLASLAAALAGVAAIAWLADPNGVWGHGLVDARYRTAYQPCMLDEHERVITPYRLRVERPTHVLTGSSRMLCGVPVLSDTSILNAGLPGATVPEIAAVIRAAVRDNPRLEEIIVGLDFYPFSAQVQESQDARVFERLDGAANRALADSARSVQDNLLNLEVLKESWLVMWRRLEGRATNDPPAAVPWPEAAIAAGIEAPGARLDLTADAAVKPQIADIVSIHLHYRYAPEVAVRLRDAIALARERGVQVVGVVFPLSPCEREAIRRLGLLPAFAAWRRALLDVVGPYWDFADATPRSLKLFTDSLHLRAAAGHALLRRVLGEPCGGCGADARALYDAGVWVDGATIDAHLAAAPPDDAVDPRCARLVAEVFRDTPTLAALPTMFGEDAPRGADEAAPSTVDR